MQKLKPVIQVIGFHKIISILMRHHRALKIEYLLAQAVIAQVIFSFLLTH